MSRSLRRTVSIIISLLFVINNCSYGLGSFASERSGSAVTTLAVGSLFKSPDAADLKFMFVAPLIAQEILSTPDGLATYHKSVRDKLRDDKSALKNLDLDNVTLNGRVIRIPYERKDTKYDVFVCLSAELASGNVPTPGHGAAWVDMGTYAFCAIPQGFNFTGPDEIYVFDYDGAAASFNSPVSDEMYDLWVQKLDEGIDIGLDTGKSLDNFSRFGIDIPGGLVKALRRAGKTEESIPAYLARVPVYLNKSTTRYSVMMVNSTPSLVFDPASVIPFPDSYYEGINTPLRMVIGSERGLGKGLEQYTIHSTDFRTAPDGSLIQILVSFEDGAEVVDIASGRDTRQDVCSNLKQMLKDHGADQVCIEPAGRWSIEITYVTKDNAIIDLLSKGYKKVHYFGDEPEKNDASVFALSKLLVFKDHVFFHDVKTELRDDAKTKETLRSMSAAGSDNEKNLSGKFAGNSNSIIRSIIKSADKGMLEVYLDGNVLKANEIIWQDKYTPGGTDTAHLGNEVNVNMFFTPEQVTNITNWIISHPIEKSRPIRFRIAVGKSNLQWNQDISYSNIAHAGKSDNVIYMGEFLFRHTFKNGNEWLVTAILDKDEYQHLQGRKHGTKQDLRERLDLVDPVASYLEYLTDAMLSENWKNLRAEFIRCLSVKSSNKADFPLTRFLSIINDICLSQTAYPVESRYPVLKAVTLLPKDKLNELKKALMADPSLREKLILVDTILLMLGEIPDNWGETHAPELIGRNIWLASSEVWNPGGGLGRVMQFHARAMHKLLGKNSGRLKTIEPDYGKRRDKQGNFVPIKYDELSVPIKDVTVVDTFFVHIGDKRIEVVAKCGVNELGINSYFIGDTDHFYTHSLYNYNDGNHPELPTWEQFTEFMSKATLEFVRRIEEKERTKDPAGWKAPVLHTNDSQFSLVGIDRMAESYEEYASVRKPYADNPVTNAIILAFSTHTYGNRHDRARYSGEDMLNAAHVPVSYWDYFKSNRGREWVEFFDFASAGLRTADIKMGVAKKHVDDISYIDRWWKGFGTLVAVTNGDDRERTCRYWKSILKDLSASADNRAIFPEKEVDSDYLTTEQFLLAKREAKNRFKLRENQYFSTRPEESGAVLNSHQKVISYTGRFVPEKAGRVRAFSDSNIIEQVKEGAQVLVLGSVQASSLSHQMQFEMMNLVTKLRKLTQESPDEYKGKLVFVPFFSLDDQRAAIAATDIGVVDSHPNTEAAGFSETDFAATGAVVVAPPWPGGEGILVSQGIKLNLDHPGEGNTVIPHIDLTQEDLFQVNHDTQLRTAVEKAYLNAIMDVLKMPAEILAEYQKTSILLSRILDANITGADYLRQYRRGVMEKPLVALTPAQAPSAVITPEPAYENKGTIANGLRIFYDQFTTWPATVTDILPFRDLSDDTVRLEMGNLVLLGILSMDQSKKPYNYRLSDTISRLPDDIRALLIDDLCGMPELNCYTITDANFQGTLDKVTAAIDARVLEHARNVYRYISISMGGNKLAVALVDGNNNILTPPVEVRWEEYPEFNNDKIKDVSTVYLVMDRILQASRELIASDESTDKTSVNFVYAALAGPMDNEKGIAGSDFKSPNLPFDRFPFRNTIHAMFATQLGLDVDVKIANDAEAALNGEHNAPDGMLRDKLGCIAIVGGGINIAGDTPVKEDGFKFEAGHNLYQSEDDLGKTHYVWGWNGTKGAHPIEEGHPALSDIATARARYGEAGEKFVTLGSSEFRKQYPDYPVIHYSSGLRDWEDRLSGPNIRRRIAESIQKALSDTGMSATEQNYYRDIEISAKAESVVGVGKSGQYERALNFEAQKGNPVAIRWIETIAIEMGQALATFIAANATSEFAKNIVLVSGINENLGKGIYEEFQDEAEVASGLDLYIKNVRLSAAKELVEYFGMDVKMAKELASGIVRSKMEYYRELVAHKPSDGEVMKAYKNRLEADTARGVSEALHTPLNSDGNVEMAARYLKGGYLQDGYTVENGASVDGSFALGDEGNQGYYVDHVTPTQSGRDVFVGIVEAMKHKIASRQERLGKPIRIVIKTGIGGQHTPFQAIADAFYLIDTEKGLVMGEYGLGNDYESVIGDYLKSIGADWDQVLVVPSSKSGSTDETMMVFTDMLYVLLKNIAASKGFNGAEFADINLETLHEANFRDGKELPGSELFSNFNLDMLLERLRSAPEAVTETETSRKLSEMDMATLKDIYGIVLGNMFFETVDRVSQSRLAAFIRNSGLDQVLGNDAPGFGGMFDNVGGRWTADLHMMTFLAFYDIDPLVYWNTRRDGIENVRKGVHEANKIGNFIVDAGITDIALVIPDELYWLGKAIEQNFNESIWQNGFANLIAVKKSLWSVQAPYYRGKRSAVVINAAGLPGDETVLNQFNIDSPQLLSLTNEQMVVYLAELFTTFYGMTHTVGTRLIARALTAEKLSVSNLNISDLNNAATKVLQENLFLRQPYVELGKGLLEERLKKLQQEEKEHPGAISRSYDDILAAAKEGLLRHNIPDVSLPESITGVEALKSAILKAKEYADANGRKLVPFIYLDGERFFDLRDFLISIGVEWVMQGTGDQHISYQQVLSKPGKYLPFIISFVPETPLPGVPAIGFAKSYLNNISPNLVRDYFAEASYTALTDLRREQGGIGLFLRVVDDNESVNRIAKSAEEVYNAGNSPDKIMDKIHELNVSLTPPVEEGKVLWHVIPLDLIPPSLRKANFVVEMNAFQDKFENLREKIKFVTTRENIKGAVDDILASGNTIVDVAAVDQSDLKGLPDNVKALVFKPIEGIDYKNFIQVEGILAALRAMQMNKVDELMSLYEFLTGTRYDGKASDIRKFLNDPVKLAEVAKFVFNLKPIKVIDLNDLRSMNKRLMQLMQSA